MMVFMEYIFCGCYSRFWKYCGRDVINPYNPMKSGLPLACGRRQASWYMSSNNATPLRHFVPQ